MSPALNPRPVVRSIDVGFGLVKYTMSSGKTACFPSKAIPSDPQFMPHRGARSRDTFDVPVDGALYEVGADVEVVRTEGAYGRALGHDFYRSSVYQALIKGALRYMHLDGTAEIDVLVLGLPINQNEDQRRFLKSTYGTKIKLGDDKFVEVKAVLVQSQPVGGFIALHEHLDALQEVIQATRGAQVAARSTDSLTILMVDPGEYTLNWLLIDRGHVITKASGTATDAGHLRVVRAVHEHLQAMLGRHLGAATLPQISDALCTGLPLRLAGVAHDLRQFEGPIAQVLGDSINEMIDGMRSMQDFVNVVVLVGGHPERYRDALQSRFAKVPCFVVPDPVFANVRGYQVIGEVVAARAALRA